MALTKRTKDVIDIAYADADASKEFLGLFGDTAGTLIAFGTFTTAGGDANESITVKGAKSTDKAMVIVSTQGATPRTADAAAAGTDKIDVVMSGDPSTDHVLTYFLFR